MPTIFNARKLDKTIVQEYEQNNFKASPKLKPKIESLANMLSNEEVHQSISESHEDFHWICEKQIFWRSFYNHEYGEILPMKIPPVTSVLYQKTG